MTDQIEVTVTGTNKVDVEFEQFPKGVHARLVQRITGLTNVLKSRIEGLIHRRTGKLASELKEDIWADNPERVVGQVGMSADFAKAGALEYGGAGRPFKVSSYEFTRVAAFGKALNAPTTVIVQAYTRSIDFTGQRFLRGPLAAMNEEIVAGIQQAVSDAEQGS